jgi:hypothetical protein
LAKAAITAGRGPRITALAIARAVPGGFKCRLTGATMFNAALAHILSDEALAKRVIEIRVTVNGDYAQIL